MSSWPAGQQNQNYISWTPCVFKSVTEFLVGHTSDIWRNKIYNLWTTCVFKFDKSITGFLISHTSDIWRRVELWDSAKSSSIWAAGQATKLQTAHHPDPKEKAASEQFWPTNLESSMQCINASPGTEANILVKCDTLKLNIHEILSILVDQVIFHMPCQANITM